MFGRIGRRILGSKLSTNELGNEKFSVFWGLPILASDAISSVAYAVDEILWALIPAIGLLSYLWVPEIAGVIIFLLLVLTISYRQIVDAYPGGGGAYIVAKGWEMVLHNNTSIFIANALFDRRNVTLAVLPFYLEDLPGIKKQNGSSGKN